MGTIRYSAIGLMSGTSLDGVDAAFLETDGEKIYRFGPGLTIPYTAQERSTISTAIQQALNWRFNGVPPNAFAEAEHVVDMVHINAIDGLMKKHPEWARHLNLIGYHGQTVLHAPKLGEQKGQTLQLGRGHVLAEKFGVPCVYDFRVDDVRAGGQGAPLAPVYHQALVRKAKLEGPVLVLNLGGVANFTLVDGDDLDATDTGPANGLLDQWMQLHGRDYDLGGQCGWQGQVDFDLVHRWAAMDVYQRPMPRSFDRYDFNVLDEMKGMSLEDGAATLSALTAITIKDCLKKASQRPGKIIVCGGGRHNQTLLEMLSLEIGSSVITADEVGWNSDMIEAEAFAHLAARHMAGLPISFPETTGVSRPITGGKVFYPASINRGSRGGA